MHDSAKAVEDPLTSLPPSVSASLSSKDRARVEFPPGADVLSADSPQEDVYLIESGSCRLLGESADGPVSLSLIKAPALAGWMRPVCGITGERVRASTAVRAVRIPREEFKSMLAENADWATSLRSRVTLTELFPALAKVLDQRGLGTDLAPEAAKTLLPHARLLSEGDDADRGLEVLLDSENGRRIALPHEKLEAWIGSSGLTGEPRSESAEAATTTPEPGHISLPAIFGSAPPPYHGASDKEEAVLACLKMLAGQLGLPFREEVIRGALKFQLEDRPSATFFRIGSVADMIGIATQPVFLQAPALADQDPPFLLFLAEHPVVVQGVSHFGILIADPMAQEEQHRQKWVEWKDLPEPGEKGYQILLCRRSRAPKGEAFGFRSFVPYIRKHTRTFIEVIIASFFIQIFALANPMIIQVIIDKVIVQESLSTLDVLAALLIICTVFGAALTAIRTFLFTDATNRIDLALGLRVLEHLYRLPLSYFHQRPVGEIASRLRELDKIRGFLTGTALTALIDAVFSVIYVAIMLFYSVELTAISLVGVPLLAALTIFVSPIIRRQLKDRAEKGAATESHLVESLTGIQTIKGQNIETRSRWKWFHRYGDTIASSFRNTLTSTSAQTVGTLISRFNDVAVL
jgi:ATP-binding cassette subfamily B protein